MTIMRPTEILYGRKWIFEYLPLGLFAIPLHMEIALVTVIVYCVCVCWAVLGVSVCCHQVIVSMSCLSDIAWLPSISPAYQLAQVAAIALVYCDLYDMHVEMYVFLYLLQSS